MRVFVTGGSGFVGGHVIEHLVAKGHEVIALSRSTKADDTIARYGGNPVRGDLDTLAASMLEGAQAVIHCAAYVEAWGPREAYWAANVDGTTRLLAAARAANVRRFVHVGTEAALFDGHDLVGIDETAPYPAKQLYPYSETKAEAERRVLAANDPKFETLSVRPRFVWGPRDTSVLPTVLRMAAKNRFAWLDGGAARTSTTHVANLVHALELALTKGVGGRAYFVADDGERTFREMLDALAKTEGVTLPSRTVSGKFARFFARIVEGAYRFVGARSEPPMTRFAVDMMSSSVTVSTSRARDELGYRPVISVSDGLADLQKLARSPKDSLGTAKSELVRGAAS